MEASIDINISDFILQEDDFNKIKYIYIAEKNKRSIAMQIEFLIEQCIAEYEREHGKINVK
jgi:hypothetical protein